MASTSPEGLVALGSPGMGAGGGARAAPVASMNLSVGGEMLAAVKDTHPGTGARCDEPATPTQHAGAPPHPAVGAGWPPGHHCHVSHAAPAAQHAAAQAAGDAAPEVYASSPHTWMPEMLVGYEQPAAEAARTSAPAPRPHSRAAPSRGIS